MSWRKTVDYALEHNAKTGDKVYVYGMYLITAKCWIYGWSADANYVRKRKLAR